MPALKPGTIFPTEEENAAIAAAAASDPDCPILTDEEWERVKPFVRIGARPVGRPKLETPKPKVTVRLSPHVLAHLRATGRGWQTRMDAVLREAVASGRV